MSRIPNPFLSDQRQQQQSSQSSSTPGFLVMTRPATGSNSYGGRDYRSPYHTPSRPSDSFIPLSAPGSKVSNEDGNRRGGNWNNMGRFNRGARTFPNQGSPRFAHPYQQTPGRMNNPFGQNQGFCNTPRGRPNTSHGGGRFGDRQDWSCDQNNFNNSPNSRRGRHRGPISDVPIDKFVSFKMVNDPWAEFDDEAEADTTSNPIPSPVVVTLEDSDAELIIDSDASVVIENSYEEGISGTEGDSSPVHDTGSDSPYVATSSTSEKDTGSDSTSDT